MKLNSLMSGEIPNSGQSVAAEANFSSWTCEFQLVSGTDGGVGPSFCPRNEDTQMSERCRCPYTSKFYDQRQGPEESRNVPAL